MKAQLPEREPRQLAEWAEQRLYERIQESRRSAEVFVLHDGPPYPTGEIHLGTALNKILKDMVVKSKTMAGFRAPYVPGWDCHGLPIETKVEKELGGKKDSVSPAEFRRRCREYASRFVEEHKRDFRRLGVFGQWDKPYLTMDPAYEACIADTFLSFLEKGYVYRGLKPVYWCFHDRTALAEAEVEYEDHTSPSIWVTFAAASGEKGVAGKSGLKSDLTGVKALIWTTTPWTLPANRALAFHPDFDYTVAESPHGPLLLAVERLDAVSAELGFDLRNTGRRWKGRELEGLLFQHPFLDMQVPAILAEHVTLDQGTGIVHTAPGHGAEDYRAGLKYGLQIYAPLDDSGRFTEGLPEYRGKTVFEANPAIIALLRSRGALLGEGKLRHSYPHCWRCHQPVIFRATEQWFVGLDLGGLRQRALEEIRDVRWVPEWGQERMREMVAARPDWCISRQRFWGVPLVVFYCEACGQRLNDFTALRNVVKWFQKEGADAWYQHTAGELLPPGARCPCGGANWRKETDILDVWFDAGSSSLAVLSEKDGTWPADVYLEGPDQYRGWFQSSLLIGIGIKDRAPYRLVVTHGWTLDAHGRPMSKSMGNVVLPRDVCQKWGADLLRLWVAAQDYTADVRMSDAVMAQLAESYRKIRNTLRFAISNLYDFDPSRDSVSDGDLWELDAWAIGRAGELVTQCRAWYDQFEFHRVFHALLDFCVVDLSSLYFDVLKDRLYTFAPHSRGRRSAQTALYRIAAALIRLAAPILVFSAEEAWKYFPRSSASPEIHAESVHIELFPSPGDFAPILAQEQRGDWERLLTVRGEVLRALEQARAEKRIASGLEAKVLLEASGGLRDLLEKYRAHLPALFIVSQVELQGGLSGADGARSAEGALRALSVLRADGAKCERCWNYSVAVGTNAEYPALCERCWPVVAELESLAARGPQPASS
jgi:isoleucyl-tRNA synthetase